MTAFLVFQAASEARRVGNLFAHLNERDGGMMVGNRLPTLRCFACFQAT